MGEEKKTILSRSRRKEVVFARAVFCCISRKMGYSFPEIGKHIDRDHTSVMHLFNKYSKNERIEEIIENYAISQKDFTPAINNISKQNLNKYSRIYQLWDGKCPIPGCGFDSVVEIHHIIPRSIGGTDEPANLILLCPNHHAMADRGMLFIKDLQNMIFKKIFKDIPNVTE
jgi:5-methylcytosine-specific restriction endonuclease McrA